MQPKTANFFKIHIFDLKKKSISELLGLMVLAQSHLKWKAISHRTCTGLTIAHCPSKCWPPHLSYYISSKIVSTLDNVGFNQTDALASQLTGC